MTLHRSVRVAWKGLASSKLRTFLMMLGIIVGMAALTIIMAVGEGTKAELARRASQMWTQAHITVFAKQPGVAFVPGGTSLEGLPPTLTTDDSRAISEQVSNVAVAAPAVFKQNVPLKYRERSFQAGRLVGAAQEWQTLRSYRLLEGEFITHEDMASSARVCLVAPTVAKELFGDDEALGATLRIENTPFRVKGLVAAKGTSPMGFSFDDWVIIPLTTFSRRLYNITYLSQIAVALRDPAQMRRSAADIESLLRERHSIARPQDQDFAARLAEDLVRAADRSSRTLTIFLAIVAAISLVVGGVVVMNIMLISVSERTKEIGIRRAVGAKRRDILAQFGAEALLVTVIAGWWGVTLGVALSLALPLFTKMHTAFSWQAVALAAVSSIAIGIVFGVQPARRAAELNPVQALRAE